MRAFVLSAELAVCSDAAAEAEEEAGGAPTGQRQSSKLESGGDAGLLGKAAAVDSGRALAAIDEELLGILKR